MATVAGFSNRYRIHSSRAVAFANPVAKVSQAAESAGPENAYKLAVSLHRRAVRGGDQNTAMSIEAALTHLTSAIGDTAHLAEFLSRSAHQAAISDFWQDALNYTDALLAFRSKDAETRGRALRNRATALSVLGRFQAAIDAYDQIEADQTVWKRMSPEYRSGFKLARAACAWYLGPVSLQEIESAPPFIGSAPATWLNYWWLMGHVAVRDYPDRLPFIREASRRTFGVDWPLELDRALWGLDLLGRGTGRDAQTGEVVEKRVRRALNDPDTLKWIGRGNWLDLYADWLTFKLRTDDKDAPDLVNTHADWCAAHGYDGWAQYWRLRLEPVRDTPVGV